MTMPAVSPALLAVIARDAVDRTFPLAYKAGAKLRCYRDGRGTTWSSYTIEPPIMSAPGVVLEPVMSCALDETTATSRDALLAGLLASAGLTLCGCGGVYVTDEWGEVTSPGGAHYHDGTMTAVLVCGHTVALAPDGGEGVCACIDLLADREREDDP
jgi:hypothetical protein